MGRWNRWLAYMDQLEEAMRVCGVHLAEVERTLSHSYERSTWRGAKRDSVASETLRRALDIPFFRQLIRAAAAQPDLDALEDPNFNGYPWQPGEDRRTRTSESWMPNDVDPDPDSDANPDAGPERDEEPPARVLAAERALQSRSRSIAVVLDNLVNSRNISAVVRTTEALGLQELHIIHEPGRPKLERKLAMYAYRWLDIVWHKSGEAAIASLHERGYRVLATGFGDHAESVETVPIEGPVALVFGSEQYGVSESVAKNADGLFYLPTPGFTSYFNVSVAVGIGLYTVDRRMRDAGLREPLSEDDKSTLRPAWYAMLGRGNAELSQRYLAWAKSPPQIRG
jgi:tRNA (guanosine-2'-O-)-methyltransferase